MDSFFTESFFIGTTTLWQLRLIWLAVAVTVWLLTYASTVFALRLRFPRFPTFIHVNRNV